MSAEGLLHNARAGTTIVTALSESSGWRGAVVVLDAAQEAADTALHNAVLGAFRRGHAWEQALAMAESMLSRGPQPDDVSWNTAMAACSQAGEWQRAVALLDAMAGLQVPPDGVSYGTAIAAAARGGHWQAALALLSAMDAVPGGGGADVMAVNSCVSACGRSERWLQALVLFHGIASRRSAPAGGSAGRRPLKPDAVSANAAMDACVRGNQWQSALALLWDLPRFEVKPNAQTFGVAIRACGLPGGHWPAAVHLLGVAQAAGLRLRADTYNAAITACRGDQQAVTALLSGMAEREVRPDTVTFNTVLGTISPASAEASSCGDWPRALALMDEMRRHAVEADNLTYGSLVSALARGRQSEMALGVLPQMRASGLEPNLVVYNGALDACEKGSFWQQALQILEQDMRASAVVADVISLSSAAAACARAGRAADACRTLAAATTGLAAPGAVELDLAAAGAVALACRAGGVWEPALQVLVHALERPTVVAALRHNQAALSAAIGCCGDAAQWQPALALLAAAQARGVEPNLVSCSAAAEALEAADQVPKALELLRSEAAAAIALPRAGVDPTGDVFVDVHLLPLGLARIAVVAAAQEAAAAKPVPRGITVITGRGAHSVAGGPTLRPALFAWLDEECGLHPALVTAGSSPEPGRICVRAEALCADAPEARQ